jgi:hypothetical protein
LVPRREVIDSQHDTVVIALVRHARVPQAKIAEADASFLDLRLHWRSHFGLFLDVIFLDPAAFFGRLLVVFLVRVVRAGPYLQSKLLVLTAAIGEPLRC